MSVLLTCYAVVSAGAIGLAAFMLLATYEHARFGRSRLRRRPATDFQPRAEVLVPCKGVDRGFESLVRALLRQRYPAYAVTFIVESKEDRAWQTLQGLLADASPVEARVLVAGPAQDCGQKVHNLLVATASLPPSAQAVVFVDSDVEVEPDWLCRLVEPLRKEGVGAVTGYRWFFPRRKNFPGAVLSALNASVALSLGNHRWNGIWGGSWIILRRTFESVGIRDAWQGALTEDYPAWKALRRAGLRIAFEPSCIVASPVEHTWRSLVEFVRRQYLITRVYAPGFWLLALSGEVVFNAAFWGGLFLGLWRWLAGKPLAAIAVSVIALYGMAALRAGIRQSYALFRFPALRESRLGPARLDVWGQPLLSLCSLGLILSSALGRRTTWRGISYRLDGPQRTTIVT